MVKKENHMFWQRIKNTGIFNVDGLFHMMRDYLISQDFEFHEVSVKHKVPSSAGWEEEYEWRATKKINEYIKFEVKVFMHLYNIREIEVVKEGKKQTLHQGSIEIWLRPTVIMDYEQRFAGNAFLIALQDWFHEYVWKHELDDIWEDEVYYRCLKFHRAIKEYLDFETKTNASEDRW
ncbi:hypothetical protein J4410_01435 [Candidatus Woesearchaeota archaeon]|nr:hypothetical protein [Candidatus Woesearchaeota archaeon]